MLRGEAASYRRYLVCDAEKFLASLNRFQVITVNKIFPAGGKRLLRRTNAYLFRLGLAGRLVVRVRDI